MWLGEEFPGRAFSLRKTIYSKTGHIIFGGIPLSENGLMRLRKNSFCMSWTDKGIILYTRVSQ